MTAKDYLTISDAAKVMGCSRVWVWTLIKKKKMKADKIGNLWVIDPVDLRAYMRTQK